MPIASAAILDRTFAGFTGLVQMDGYTKVSLFIGEAAFEGCTSLQHFDWKLGIFKTRHYLEMLDLSESLEIIGLPFVVKTVTF